MKQKRTYVTLLLVVALLALGIAYAALGGVDMSLTTTATATAETREVDVTVSAITAGEKSGNNIEITPGLPGGQAGTVAVAGFSAKDQTAKVTFAITNNEADVAVTLDELNGASVVDNGWYKVDYTGITEGQTLAAGATVNVEMTITMTTTPVDATDVAAADEAGEFEFTFKANPVGNAE